MSTGLSQGRAVPRFFGKLEPEASAFPTVVEGQSEGLTVGPNPDWTKQTKEWRYCILFAACRPPFPSLWKPNETAQPIDLSTYIDAALGFASRLGSKMEAEIVVLQHFGEAP